MKIGLLTTSYPRFEGDIPGFFVAGFARALARHDNELEVLAPEPAEARFAAPPRAAGVELRWVRYLRPRALQRTFYGAGVLDNLRRDPLAGLGLVPFTLGLARATRERLPHWDAVVSHWALPCALIAGSLRGARPHLAILHSADVFLLERLPLRRELALRIAIGADALVFSSRDLRARFAALLPPLARADHAGRMHVCAMGIDALEPAPSAKERKAAREALGLTGFTLLSLGRLIDIKGIEHAIEAAAAEPGVELIVAGDGPARGRLEALAWRLGVAVRFTGEVRGAEKRRLFAAADAFVLPSVPLASGRTEGMPTTLLEAMQHGLPVIASDVGGVADVVASGENGLLVPPGGGDALLGALRRLCSDAGLARRLAAGARETAAMYEWDTLAPRFLELLRREDFEM